MRAESVQNERRVPPPWWPRTLLRVLALVLAATVLGVIVGQVLVQHRDSKMWASDFPAGHPGQVAATNCRDVLSLIGSGPLPDTRYDGVYDWSFRLTGDRIAVVYTVPSPVYTDGSTWGRVVGWNCSDGLGDQWQ